jgi:hypothetical protein
MSLTTPSKNSRIPTCKRVLASAEKKGPHPKKASIETMAGDDANSVSLVEIKEMLLNVMKDQDSMRKAISKLDSTSATSAATISSKIDKLREDMYVELGKLDSKVVTIEGRLNALEERQEAMGGEEEYPIDKSIVIINMREEEDEDPYRKCMDLIRNGLGLRDIKPVRCQRLMGREGKPGVIKVQLRSKQDKILSLNHKKELARTHPYKKVYIRSAQSHEERLMRLNLQTLMRDLPIGDNYRFTGNGRLVKKDPVHEDPQPGSSSSAQGWQQQRRSRNNSRNNSYNNNNNSRRNSHDNSHNNNSSSNSEQA